jgi:hypothetical protein
MESYLYLNRNFLLSVTALNASLLQKLLVLLLRHALASLFNYGTHMSRSNVRTVCAGV